MGDESHYWSQCREATAKRQYLAMKSRVQLARAKRRVRSVNLAYAHDVATIAPCSLSTTCGIQSSVEAQLDGMSDCAYDRGAARLTQAMADAAGGRTA